MVLVGADDVPALVSRKVRGFFRISKHLPSEPSPEWFRESLEAIAHRLRAETSATIALCSLPPIGEDPASANLFQTDQRVPIGWQLLAHHHSDTGVVELTDAPSSTMYLPSQLLAKRLHDA